MNWVIDLLAYLSAAAQNPAGEATDATAAVMASVGMLRLAICVVPPILLLAWLVQILIQRRRRARVSDAQLLEENDFLRWSILLRDHDVKGSAVPQLERQIS